MSGSGAVSRNHGGDRFYNPPPVRRQRQLLLQQQQQQQQQRKARAVRPEVENRTDSESSDGSTALSKPPSVCSTSSPPGPLPPPLTNLDRFIEAVTPTVQAQFCSQLQGNKRRWKGREPDLHLYYSLGDLWDSFGEWSVYGVGVPLVLNAEESIMQYYVPFLSGLQLYVDPVKPPSRSRRSGAETNTESSRETSSGGSSDCEADRQSAFQQSNLNSIRKSGLPTREKSLGSSSSDEPEATLSPGTLIFEYMENEQPYNRKPLADKISALASQFPELRKYKSCDLLPSSWISVAWYPIYRIPVGPTLKDLDASFLTFHSLSTNSKCNGQSWSHGAGGWKILGGFDPALKLPLPVLGLASYKLKGSILSPSGPLECQLEDSLLQAADRWLRHLRVYLPDYQFFLSHYSPWR